MQAKQTIPILRIFDEAKAREFYVDFLGFQVDFEHRFAADLPLYMGVSRGGCTLHLSEHHGDGTPGTAVYVKIEGLDAFQAELIGKLYKNARPGIQDHDWARVMTIADPFGNALRFAEEHPAPSAS